MIEGIFTSFLLALMSLTGQGQAAEPLTRQFDHHYRHSRTTPAPTPSPSPAVTNAPTTASTEIASEQTCPGQADLAKTASALTCLASNARVFHDLTPIKANSTLMASAAAKNQDMLTCGYGHTACGRAGNYWIKNKGYTGKCSGENIAMGQRSPREVFTAWMNSPGHRANILEPKFRDIGVSQISGPRGPLWVMQLGGC